MIPARVTLAEQPTSLRLRNIRRIFDGGVTAVDNLSLEIPAGQFVAMLGPSGCGKSTLLRIIAGLDQPTDGFIEIGEGKIAYVFQDAHLLPWRNVLRNVALPLELMGVSRGARLRAAAEALDQVGLSDASKRYPAQLSGGMKMRVSLARALVTKPNLLLLDEPFAALDEITRQKLDEQLRTLWLLHRMTVVFVTHSTGEAAFLADRAVVLSRRPASIVEDMVIDLGAVRVSAMRTGQKFATATQLMYDALKEGGA